MCVVSWDGNHQRPNVIILLQFCDMLSIAVSYIVIFLNLSQLQIIFQSKTLSTSSVSSNQIKFSVYSSYFINFLSHFLLPKQTLST